MSSKGRIHYDRTTGRFRDADGRYVERSRALKSSIARAELAAATRPRKRKKRPAAAPRPKAPPLSEPPKKSRPAPPPALKPKAQPAAPDNAIHYDKASGRFRRGGRFVSRSDALKSSVARAELAAATRPKRKRVKKPPVKAPPPPKKKARKKKKPKPPPRPEIIEVENAPGQFIVDNADMFNMRELAKLILLQIESGATRFRFWYRMPEISVEYPLGIGSTAPMLKNEITQHETLSEVIGFLRGRRGKIRGKVTTYWYSFRHKRYEAKPHQADAYKMGK